MPKTNYYLSVDIGQQSDYTALATLQAMESSQNLNLVDLLRVPLKTSYPKIANIIRDRYAVVSNLAEEVEGTAQLGIDVTGVGRPVADMVADLSPVYVTITGGDKVHQDGNEYKVPKRDLISSAQILMQNRRLKAPSILPEIQTLIKELQNFKYKINIKTAHDSYEAWREGDHDDLVLAVAIGCWMAEYRIDTTVTRAGSFMVMGATSLAPGEPERGMHYRKHSW